MSTRAGIVQGVAASKVLIVLVTVSLALGLAVGYRTPLEVSAFFRILVLANVFMLGYLVLMRNLVAGIIVYLYSIVFLQWYWRIVLPGSWPDLDMPRLMFVFLWLIFLLEILMGSRRLVSGGSIGTFMLLILAAIGISIVVGTGKRVTFPMRVYLNGYIIPYAMFLVAKNVFTDRRTVEKFIFWLAVPLAFYFPATSIFEHYKINALLFPRYIGTQMVMGNEAVHWGGRAMGTFIQPAVTGNVMVVMFVLALYALSITKGVFARIYSWILIAITPIGVFFTYTRANYVGFMVAMVVLAVFSRRRRLVGALLIVAVGLAVLGNWSRVTTSEREAGGVTEIGTAQARVVVAEASIQMFMDNPFMGCGFDQFIHKSGPYVSQIRQTILGYRPTSLGEYTNQHNQFFSILAELGLMGFIPFVMLYVVILRLLGRASILKTDELDREFVVATWAVLGAYVTTLMFIEPKWFEFMNTIPFMLVGIVAGAYERTIARRPGRGGEQGVNT